MIMCFQILIWQDVVDDAQFNRGNRLSFRRQNGPVNSFNMITPSPMTSHIAFYDTSEGYAASTPHPYPGTSDGSPPPPYTGSSYPGQDVFSDIDSDFSGSRTNQSSVIPLPRFQADSSRSPQSRIVELTESVQYNSSYNIREGPLPTPHRPKPNRNKQPNRASEYICSADARIRPRMNLGSSSAVDRIAKPNGQIM